MAVTLFPKSPQIFCSDPGASFNHDLPGELQKIRSPQAAASKKLSNEEALDVIVKAARSAIGDIVKASRQKQSTPLSPEDATPAG